MKRCLKTALLLLLTGQGVFAGYAPRLYHPSKLPLGRWYDDQTSLRTYLLSFPRSGNTWTRYCLEFLTKRPTLEKMKDQIHLYNCPLGWSFDMGTNYDKPPIWKMHTIDWFNNKFKAYYPEKETLLLLVRNYKEAIPRHKGTLSVNMLQKKNDPHRHYFVNLDLYDRWNPDKRLLVYYEDLIEQPKETLAKILQFLGEDTAILDEFMAHYEHHKAVSLKIYKVCNGTPVTQGNATIHHSKKISKKERLAIDAHIKKEHGKLWERYLSRYAESD